VLENLTLRNRINVLQSNLTLSFDIRDVPYTMAEVIGYTGQFHDRNLIVSKGSGDGVEFDSPVVSAD